jgi:hypothetical protein
MNGNRYYMVRLEGAKWGVSFGSALAIAISYTTNSRSSGRSSWHPGLAVRDLLRAVPVVAVADVQISTASTNPRSSRRFA